MLSFKMVFLMSEWIFRVRNVDKQTYENFKLLLMSIYGDYYGILGREVTKALQLYIDTFADAHTQKSGATKSKIIKTTKRHIKLLEFLFGFNGNAIPKYAIEEYIRDYLTSCE